MARFFTDFSDTTVGATPTGWAVAESNYNATASWQVVADAGATGGKVLRYSDLSDPYVSRLQWLTPGSFLNGEIVVKFRISFVSGEVRPVSIRGNTATQFHHYYSSKTPSSTRMAIIRRNFDKLTDSVGLPSDATLGNSPTSSTPVVLANTWYGAAIRAVGNQVSIQLWTWNAAAADFGRPATWAITVTDTTSSGPTGIIIGALPAGYAGIAGSRNILGASVTDFDIIGVATAGETAPLIDPRPSVPNVTLPAGPTHPRTTATLTWTASTDLDAAPGEVLLYDGRMRVGAGAWTTLFTGVTALTYAWNLVDYGGQVVQASVRARDVEGNVSEYDEGASITVDGWATCGDAPATAWAGCGSAPASVWAAC